MSCEFVAPPPGNAKLCIAQNFRQSKNLQILGSITNTEEKVEGRVFCATETFLGNN